MDVDPISSRFDTVSGIIEHTTLYTKVRFATLSTESLSYAVRELGDLL